MAAASPARAARAGGTAPPAERASRASTGPPSVHQILEWLAAGQVVTCTLEERPATPLLRRLAAQAPAALEDKLATVAATVLMVSLSTEQVVLRADAFADPVE